MDISRCFELFLTDRKISEGRGKAEKRWGCRQVLEGRPAFLSNFTDHLASEEIDCPPTSINIDRSSKYLPTDSAKQSTQFLAVKST